MIKTDIFDKKDSYAVDTNITKMCWSCETKNKSGYMVKDISKNRRIFFCQDCYNKLTS